MRISRWAHLFSKDGLDHFAIFHSLNIEIVYLESKFHEMIDMFKIGGTIACLIKRFSEISRSEILDVCDELIKLDILVPVRSNDQDVLSKKQRKYVHTPGLETLYLVVTDNCNLRCRYCFINNNMPTEYKCSVMDWDTAKMAVDMYFSGLVKNPTHYDDYIKMIVFYGGEPLLNFKLIKRVVEYAKSEYSAELERMGKDFRFSAVTNGTAITKEVAKFFGANPTFDIAISIDGPKNIHDQKRVFADDGGSFEKAMAGYELLKEVSGRKDITVSCTVDSHNIDELPKLIDLHKQHGFPAINLNTLLDTEQQLVTEAYMKKVSRKMLEYFVLARQVGVHEERVMRKAKAIIDKEIHPYDCQATGSQIVCSPDGKLGVCHEGIGAKNFFFDKVRRDFDFHTNSTVQEWKQRTPLNMPQCWDCPALGTCGGGCAYSAWLRNGSIWSVDDRFCVHSLETLEWLIWDLYEHL